MKTYSQTNNEIPLNVIDLKKYYGDFLAVDKVSFKLKNNDIFALIGPNGAGKSTILKIITTILSPSSGSIKIFGLDIKKQASEIRKLISYLPEEAGAYKNLKGLQYLDFMANIFEANKSKRNKSIEKAIQIASLGNAINHKIGTYSKGMTRKILIARTLMHNPKLAILDEPTSGLDVINAREVRDIIRDYSNNGTSILLSSHNMLEIQYLAKTVAIINHGKIHTQGSVKQLIDKYHAENLEDVFIKATK